jgi:poly-beta-1,6-N-acetyl-D-glucosamine synthase
MLIFHISYFIFYISYSILLTISLLVYAVFVGSWWRSLRKDTKKADIQPAEQQKANENPIRPNTPAPPTITILICARNEAINLARFLPSILRQHVPPQLTCEILIVDDDSQDHSQNVLRQLQTRMNAKIYPRKKNKKLGKKKQPKCENNPQLRILCLSHKTSSGKKYALSQGIAAARGQWVLVTDADCRANSRFWLKNMWQTAQTSPSIDFVLGFSPYMKTIKTNFSSRWLNAWLRFEAIFTLCQYATAAFWRQPYMGVGRNMMYRKTVFTQQYDWTKNADLASGDDDLFVNALASAKNTRLCLNPQAWMSSQAVSTWHSYYRQKRRHFSAGTRYRWQHKLMLGLWVQSHTWTWLLLPSLFFLPQPYIYYLFIFILFRIFVFYAVIRAISRKFGSADLGWRIFILDAALPIFYLAFAPILMLGTKIKTWN